MTEYIIKRLCVAHAPTGEILNTYVGVTQPIHLSGLDWECNIDLDKIDSQKKMTKGIDSWHAVQMGMYMVYRELQFKEMVGWKFLWLDGEESDLRSLLPTFGQELAE
ncbi:hypothetical protein F2P44_31645 [Massilia sp. CCM 8695]|uniref:DUF4902 domain-containing protein n=1 Tax=Massilia frigida TaxID=2609281 RepID=A0ABX0NGH8_9BURK|nr:hypothetical protein [Massilia frigida]NHZ83788.1 hypothetical protein [Massilia frigida]